MRFDENITAIVQTQENTTNIEEKNKINILLLGRGGWEHDAPNLTDTIILASINTDTGAISMLSIPRDLYVEYENGSRRGKINRIYEHNLIKFWESSWISAIKNKVSEITGQDIDYYVNVDFEGFVEIIDVLDWVEVNIPENFVDNQYPDGNLGYTTFILRKWVWTLDGKVALKYARSRHSTSDFDRSVRQQQILSALKDKVLWLGYLKSPTKTKNLYSAIRNNIKTDIDVKTILELATIFKWLEETKVLSFNLNDSCFYGSTDCDTWWILYIPERHLFNNLSVLLPEWSDVENINDYVKIKKYADIVFDNTEIFSEKAIINIFNSTTEKFIASTLADNLKRYGFSVPSKSSVGNVREKKFENSILYYNGLDQDSKTLEKLSDFLDIKMQEVDFPLYADDPDTKIEIVLGDDYEEITKIDILY